MAFKFEQFSAFNVTNFSALNRSVSILELLRLRSVKTGNIIGVPDKNPGYIPSNFRVSDKSIAFTWLKLKEVKKDRFKAAQPFNRR